MSINTIGNIPCRGSTHYFGPPTGPHGAQVCSCGERYGGTIGGKFRMYVTAAGAESIAGEVACTPGARYESPVIACRYCDRIGTRADLTEYQLQIWDGECGERVDRFHACSSEACRILADKDVGDARMNCERRALAHLARAAEQCRDLGRADLDRIERIIGTRLDEHDTDAKDNGCRCTACCREKFRRMTAWRRADGIPIATYTAPEQIPAVAHAQPDALTSEVLQQIMQQIDNVLRNDPPTSIVRLVPLRADGFDQRAVDAAKAVLLAQVPRKGRR